METCCQNKEVVPKPDTVSFMCSNVQYQWVNLETSRSSLNIRFTIPFWSVFNVLYYLETNVVRCQRVLKMDGDHFSQLFIFNIFSKRNVIPLSSSLKDTKYSRKHQFGVLVDCKCAFDVWWGQSHHVVQFIKMKWKYCMYFITDAQKILELKK